MSPPRPCRLALIGISGAGKTTLASRLGRRWGWPVIDLDALVESAAEKPLAALFAAEGEAGFRVREAEALRSAATLPIPLILATGGGVVNTPEARDLLRREFTPVWLEVDPGTAAERLGESHGRPLLQGAAPVVDTLAGQLTERGPWYLEVARVRVDTRPPDLETRVEHALGSLGESSND